MSSLDKSLDEIMSAKPRGRGIRKRGRGVNIKGRRAVVAPRQPAAAAIPRAPAATNRPRAGDPSTLFEQGSKIILSNLPSDVSEQQIKDLFNVQVGRVTRVSLAYGPHGKSTGVATVQFGQKGDAKKAYDIYDGKLIDNSRRLKVEIVLDPRHTKAPLANRIEQSAPPAALVAATTATNQVRGTRRRRGRGGRSGPSGAGRRPKKTVEDLDAEMTDYFDTGVAAGPAS